MDAAYWEWLRQQGSRLTWPKADYMAVLVAGATLFGIFTLYSVPDSETTIWLRSQIAFWMNAALFALAIMNAAAFALWNGGKGITIRFEEAPALHAGEQPAELPDPGDWTFPKMTPYLTNHDRLRIAATTNPKLNEETAARIKAGLATGMTSAEIATQTGYSLDTVKKYAALIRKGFEATESAPLSFDL